MINIYTPSVFNDNFFIKSILHHYCADNDAKSMMKHLIFLGKFAVLSKVQFTGIHTSQSIAD